MHLLTGYAKPITALAVSPDGMIFAAGAEKRSRIVLTDVPD